MRPYRMSNVRRRRGAALVYVALAMVALMGFCSLGVDLGRYETAQAAIYNAAMAAARAGANDMAEGGTSTTTPAAALAVAEANQVDGQPITSSMVTVKYGKWNGTTFTNKSASNYSACNAVQVTITYNVPLAFAKVLGITTKTATKYSTAEMVVQVDTPTVYGTGNPWLAGEPAGTTASQSDPNYSGLHKNSDHQYPDDIAGTPGYDSSGNKVTSTSYSTYEPNASPTQVAYTVTPGSRVTITNTSGSVSYDYDTPVGINATGNTGTTPIGDDAAAKGISEHGMSDAYMPYGSMNAVFLSGSTPDSIATPPPPLYFSTQAERDYVNLAPQLQQVFYTGSGTTSTGQQQSIQVPANATRLFLGIMDGWEWDNNTGSFNCTVTQITITTVQ